MTRNQARDPEGRLSTCGFLFILLAFTIAGLVTFQDYGITWDEHVQTRYGELVIEHFKSGFQDQRCLHYRDLFLYGPLFESLSAAVSGLAHRDRFEIHHLLVWSTSLLAVIAVFQLGRYFQASLTALFAPLCLIMLPRFYGDAFTNSKDIPFACAFAWAMVYVFRLLLSGGRGWRNFVLCGVTIGIALSIRVGAVLLFLNLAAGLVLALGARLLLSASPGPNPDRGSFKAGPEELNSRSDESLQFGKGGWQSSAQRNLENAQNWPCLEISAWRLILKLAVLTALAYLIMIAAWPWLRQHPVSHLLNALVSVERFPSQYPVLFEGKVFASSQLPCYYLPKYLWITTPPTLIILFCAGLGAMLARITRHPRDSESFGGFMILFWFFFPIVSVVLTRPNMYDGIRHFLFLLPALAVICGYGGAFLTSLLRRKVPRAALLLVLVLSLVPIKDLVSLHPYQYTYFNLFAGGLPHAWRRYETDYWVRSYKEAAEWINARAGANPDRKLKLVLAANDYCRVCAEHYLRPNVEVYPYFTGTEVLPAEFDYYLATRRYGLDRAFPQLPVVHTIGRKGAVFAVIKSGPNALADGETQ